MKVIWLYYLVLINPYKFMCGLSVYKPYIGLYNFWNLISYKLTDTPYILQWYYVCLKVFISEQIAENRFAVTLQISDNFSPS